MATGSITISVTIPTLNLGGSPAAFAASNALAATLLAQPVQQIQASGATSGNILYPPGSQTVVGNWSYSPAS
jgi:hypothetical protein